ncbi:MAG: aminotransferase class I/II-fold pyridoxal phosphate-dependent enzyme, partial [Anaerolineales bacterium]
MKRETGPSRHRVDDESGTFFTQAVHAGEERSKPFGSLTMPIVQTSTYVFEDTAALVEYMERKLHSKETGRGEYGRYGNPTQHTVERKLAKLEGGEAALLCASGTGATASTLLTMLSKGKHLILVGDPRPRTRQLCHSVLKRFGVEVSIVPTNDYQTVEASVGDNTRLILAEIPTGVHLRVPDIPRLADIARRRRLKLIVDSTFATPSNLKPLSLGADLVIHDAGAYLAGHNDLLAGAVIGPKGQMINAIQDDFARVLVITHI